MIEIGTLVRYKHDGDIGLVTAILMDHGHVLYLVKWGDGTQSDHIASEFEVLS